MTKRRNPLHRIKLVYRRSSPLLKCVVLAAIVLSLAALLALRVSLLDEQERNRELQNQAAELEAENKQLEENISHAGSQEGIEQIAGEKLGLVDPDSSFFTPVD